MTRIITVGAAGTSHSEYANPISVHKYERYVDVFYRPLVNLPASQLLPYLRARFTSGQDAVGLPGRSYHKR
jgi:hypothetical protein